MILFNYFVTAQITIEIRQIKAKNDHFITQIWLISKVIWVVTSLIKCIELGLHLQLTRLNALLHRLHQY